MGKAHRAHVMPGPDVVGVGVEDAAIELLRFPEAPGPVQLLPFTKPFGYWRQLLDR